MNIKEIYKKMNKHFLIRIYLLIIILFVGNITTVGQDNEQVAQLLKKLETVKEDTSQAKIYFEIAEQLDDIDELKAKYYLDKAANIFKKHANHNGLAEVYYSLGFINEYFNKKDSSLYNFNLAISLAKEKGYEKKLAKYYTGKGWYYMRQKDNITAITAYQNSIEICKKYNLKHDWADALRKIANLLLKTEDYQKSFNLYKEAINLYTLENDTLMIAQTIGGLGYAFKEAKVYDSATYYLNIASTKFTALNNYTMAIIANAELANLSNLLGIPNQALAYINKANELRNKTGYSLSDDVINLYHGNALTANGNYSEAIKKYLKGIEIAQQQGDIDNVHNGYLWLFETYEKNKDYKNAFKYQTLFENLEDSVANEEKLNALKELSTKYDFEKQQRELEKKKFEVKKKNIILLAIIGFSCLMGAVVYLYIKRKNAQQKAILQQRLNEQQEKATIEVLEAEEKERKRIATDLHDGVGQLMTAAWLNLQAVNTEQKNIAPKTAELLKKSMDLVDESCKEVRAVSHNMMPNALLKKGLSNAVREFIQQINTKQTKINLQTDDINKPIPIQIETVLYRIIQESVNNVIKHANASSLDISIGQDEAGIDVMIEDNGKGFNFEEAIKKDGIGLENIQSRVYYLKGAVEWNSAPNKGTLVAIHIPIINT